MRRRTAIAFALAAGVGGQVAAQCDSLDIQSVEVSDASVCAGTQVDLNLVGDLGVAVTFQWQDSTTTWTDITGATGDALSIVPDGTTFYRCLVSCLDSTVISEEVEVVVNPLPTVTATVDPSGPFCDTANTTLFADGQGVAFFTWSPADELSSTTGGQTTCTATVSRTYTVTADDGNGCIATDSLEIVVLERPTVTLPSDLLICSTDDEASLLFAFTGAAPFDFTLQTPNGPVDHIAFNEDTLIVQPLVEGAYLITALADAGCAAIELGDTVFVQTVDPPVLTAVAIEDTICFGNSSDLVGNDPTPFTGIWTIASGSPPGQLQPVPGSDSSVVLLPDTVGTYHLTWTITGSTCPDRDTSIVVVVNGLSIPAFAGPDGSYCLTGSFPLLASDPTPGLGTWTLLSGPAGTFADIHAPATTFAPSAPGVFTFQWNVANAPCLPDSDQVEITVLQPDTPPVIVGLSEDGTACDGEYQTLFIQGSGSSGYSWQCPYWQFNGLSGDTITAHWDHPGGEPAIITTTITLIRGGGCPDTATFDVQLSSAQSSCPKGIVYFEPHGLAIIDPLADHFIWGRLQGGLFIADSARTDQTTFDAAHIAGCDTMPYYIVRTSINGLQCWSTTMFCATPASLMNECPSQGGGEHEVRVRAYPNPSRGGPVTVEATGESEVPLRIMLSDAQGRSLATGLLPLTGLNTITLGLERFGSGVYVLRAWSTEFDRTIKLIID
ncbi:MAG: T9SS type A sorting domain-containing protein [Flavobacteriales bacterium]|nr:T9SS type A sorting domain-containing protein [Flavobacteriales bacterium]